MQPKRLLKHAEKKHAEFELHEISRQTAYKYEHKTQA